MTAVLGEPGVGKTILALAFLVRGACEGERGLLISLKGEGRELLDSLPFFIGDRRFDWQQSFDRGLLVVHPARPGFITPEEFVDRVVERLMPGGASVGFSRVVFDNSAQLRPRFPLLAETGIFLATMIDIFKYSGLTSLFIGVTGEGSDTGLNHELITLADNAFYLNRAAQANAIQTRVTKLAGRFASQQSCDLSVASQDRIVLSELRKSE